jgi:hypothetical protein
VIGAASNVSIYSGREHFGFVEATDDLGDLALGSPRDWSSERRSQSASWHVPWSASGDVVRVAMARDPRRAKR